MGKAIRWLGWDDAAIVNRAPKTQTIWSFSLLTSAFIVVVFALLASRVTSELLPVYYLLRQDLPVAFSLTFFYLAALRIPDPGGTAIRLTMPGPLAIGFATAIFCIGLAGHYWLLSGYSISRDEQMAIFDGAFLARGEFVGQIPEQWQGFKAALNDTFIIRELGEGFWASGYRPVNAALFGLAGRIGATEFINPLWSVVGLIATWRVAMRLWPDARDAHSVTIILYALSSQMLVASMTSYAMSAHLALNMLWLALYLADRPWSHISASFVGALAVGLHQIPYHPMFVAPFVVLTLWQRRWATAGLYGLGYTIIILAWTYYSRLPLEAAGVVALQHDSAGIAYLFTRMLQPLEEISLENIWIMGANMVRFFAWQHLLLLPLMLIGIQAAWRSRDPMQIALIAAFMLTILVKLALRPHQGHGWGFRYMHGLIGVACLIAAYGWMDLRRRNLIGWRSLKWSSIATMLVVMPWLAVQAHHFSEIFASVDRRIARQPAQVVIVDDGAVPYAKDLVLNTPNVNNSPVRLRATALNSNQLVDLCNSYSVAVIGPDDLAGIAHAFDRDPLETESLKRLSAVAPAGCLTAAFP